RFRTHSAWERGGGGHALGEANRHLHVRAFLADTHDVGRGRRAGVRGRSHGQSGRAGAREPLPPTAERPRRTRRRPRGAAPPARPAGPPRPGRTSTGPGPRLRVVSACRVPGVGPYFFGPPFSLGLLLPGAWAGLPAGNRPGGKLAFDGAMRSSSRSTWKRPL